MKFPFFPIAAAIAVSLFASAQTTVIPPAELSLRKAIEQALDKNLGLKIQSLAPEIAKEAVIAQESQFDSNLFTRASISQNDLSWEDASKTPRQTTSDSRSYSAGVSKKISTGAQVTASVSHSRSDGSSFNPDLGQLVGGGLNERAALSLQITQPLLRDFGKNVNQAQIRQAKSQERVADLQTRNTIFNLLQVTEIAYWELSDAYQRRELRQSNIELSEKLLEEARERNRLGLATRLDILQAEANLAQRREETIRADQAIREAADELLARMGALDESLAIDAQPQVAELPVLATQLPEFAAVQKTAFEQNFDTDIQEEILEQLEQDRILAKNSQRPEVDVTLSTSYNGLSPISASDAFNEVLDRRGEDWGLSLSFNLPWGSRAAKSNVRQTKHRIDQAEIRLIEIKQDLIRTIRSAWRNLNSSREQLRAAEIVVELQQATFEQERGKFDEGLSTFRILLETQRDLDNAKLRLLDAKLSATNSEIRLARVEGTLLQRHGLDWNQTPIQ